MKNKDSLKSLLALLLLMPLAVFASTKEEDSIMWFAYIWVAFASLHWSFGVLKPLSEIINQDNPKKIFWILFVIGVSFFTSKTNESKLFNDKIFEYALVAAFINVRYIYCS